jgi:predicted metal-dependent hydrolase
VGTKFHVVAIKAGKVSQPALRINGNRATIVYPESLLISDNTIQTAIRDLLVEVYRKEAKTHLPERLAALAADAGFRFRKVFIKNLKSRWGSCSGKNNINLNLHLMRLPDHLIEYVLMHELTHTEIKNHSKQFWQLLEEKCPGARTLDKQLNQYQITF